MRINETRSLTGASPDLGEQAYRSEASQNMQSHWVFFSNWCLQWEWLIVRHLILFQSVATNYVCACVCFMKTKKKRCPVGLAQMLSSCGKSIKIKWIPLWMFVSWFHPSMYSLNGISNVCLAMSHFNTRSHFQYFMYYRSHWKLKRLVQELDTLHILYFPSHNTVTSGIIATLDVTCIRAYLRGNIL